MRSLMGELLFVKVKVTLDVKKLTCSPVLTVVSSVMGARVSGVGGMASRLSEPAEKTPLIESNMVV